MLTVLRRRTDSGELGAHMYNHDDGHDQCQNVHKVVGRLKDECVGDLDRPGIALRLYAHAVANVLVAHRGA